MTVEEFSVVTPIQQADRTEIDRAMLKQRSFTMPSTGVSYLRLKRFHISEDDDAAYILWGLKCACGDEYRFVRSENDLSFTGDYPVRCASCADIAELSPATAADMVKGVDPSPARAAVEALLMASPDGVGLQQLSDAGVAALPVPDGPDTRHQIVMGALLKLQGSLPIRVEGERVFLDV